MENASKALIIAGAILISIVLITLGVVIIGQGQDVVNSSNIDDQAVSTWNQKFTQYAGERVSGSNVNQLINQVLASNRTADNAGETSKVIEIDGQAGSDANKKVTCSGSLKRYNTGSTSDTETKGSTQCTKKALPGAFYNVTMSYNGYGYICIITVTPV